MALLEISNLSVTIEANTSQPIKLIDNFSLVVQEGEVISLVGETGSGKSIIARILSGHIRKSWSIECKSFRFNGRELLIDNHTIDTRALTSSIGIIHQDPATVIDPTKKIGQQLVDRIAIEKRGKHWTQRFFKRKERLKEITNLLTRLGIKSTDGILDSYYNELSQTEAQIMAIVMTLVTDPLVIIADEPTTGMSSVSAQRVQSLFKRLNANFKKTIVFLSNNIITMRGLINQAHILYFGQVVERFYDVDEIQYDLINYSHHPYTRLFLQSLPNFASNNLIYKARLYSIPGGLRELENIPVGCRFGPRCEFAQRKCMQFPPFVRERGGISEFACHYPIDYMTPAQNLHVKEVREQIKREIEMMMAEDQLVTPDATTDQAPSPSKTSKPKLCKTSEAEK